MHTRHTAYKDELPGLVEECDDFLVRFGIYDLSKFTSLQWKNLVKKKILEKNRDDLLTNVKKNYKKINYNEMNNEQFELKPYLKELDMSSARDNFRLRSKMTRTVKFNFPSDRKYQAELWSCWHCSSIDSQTHIMVCHAYQEFREGKDLGKDQDLVNYFRQVLKLRDAMND